MKKSRSLKSVSKITALEKLKPKDFLIVGIGASAGGIQALREFFENVPVVSDIAYVVILHLSPDHDSQLAEVLQTATQIPVTQVKEKVQVEPNHVYVVPPNKSLSMRNGYIIVSPIETVEERRAPVDIFFRTLAESHLEHAVCVVLSGTGANGSMGLKRIKELGGAAFVQNPRESEFSEMPRNSIATELVDDILNVADIPAKIINYKESLSSVKIPLESKERAEEDQNSLREIFTQLRVRTGHDFSNYKRPTILRRIARRINIKNLPDLQAYAAYLHENTDEAQALLKDLLISVTNFFRDKEAFKFLEADILPRILQGKTSDDQIRVWVAGCATGEEAYSIAMLFAERTLNVIDAPSVQIFATDIDEVAINAAREGLYTLNDAADVSAERLRHFFSKEGDHYRIRREIREMVLFAKHNLLKDPPFARLDLATCRNLMIYLNQSAQERVMQTLQFALKPGSYLFIGSSESVDGAGDLYVPVSRVHHIFQSREAGARSTYPVAELSPVSSFEPLPRLQKVLMEQTHPPLERMSYGNLHQRLLEQYAPPSIVVNENYEIVHLSQSAGRFLQITGGEASLNLLKVIREDLRLELRTALYQAVQQQKNVEAKNLKVSVDNRPESINIYVRPVLQPEDTSRGFLLILFEKSSATAENSENIYTASEPVSHQLEEELIRSKEHLRASAELYEVQSEEAKAANEELQAMNEEMRSTAEELETSKEELQSFNEELTTVNQELKVKIEELSESNNNFQNLINSNDIGTIFLDRSFRIHSFTPAVCQIFNLIPADFGRPLSDITNRLEYKNLIEDAELVLDKLQMVEREVISNDKRVFMTRMLPYRTADDRINGVVISFFDITIRKRAEEAQHLLFSIVESSEASIFTINFEGNITSWNKAAESLYGYPALEVIGKPLTMLTLPSDFTELFNQTKKIKNLEIVEIFETINLNKDGREMNLEIVLSPVKDESQQIIGISTIARDISERKKAAQNILESEMKYRRLFDSIDEGFCIIEMIFDKHGKPCNWRFIEVNPAFEKHYGLTDVIGKTILELAPNIEPKWFEIYGKVAISAESVRFTETSEIMGRTFDIYAFQAGISENRQVAVVFTDITKRIEAEEDLRKSKEHLSLMIESATDYAIFTLTPDNKIKSWNTAAENVFGWTEAEALGQSGEIIFTPEDRTAGVPEQEIETTLTEGRAPAERIHLRRDGSRFYVSGVTTLLKDGNGNVQGFAKIARDMSRQIKSEKAIRDKQILQRIVSAQEEERKRIARDLHDELGQQLTALRLKLDALKHSCDDEKICDMVDEIQLMAQSLDNGVDFLAWELRPTMLDDLGLVAALNNYVKQWSSHSGITAELLVSSLKSTRLDPEVETNLYRITQEALNNIHKHAKAQNVEVMLEKRDKVIVLIIEDNGIGFNPKLKKNQRKGIGLIGMKERATLIGGKLEIESIPQRGTTIYVQIPTPSLKQRSKNGK